MMWNDPGNRRRMDNGANRGARPRKREGAMDKHGSEEDPTMVHFHKSFGVMQELFAHPHFSTIKEDLLRAKLSSVNPQGPLTFLDLGCAPGGFSAYMTQPQLLSHVVEGYGVTLPQHLGGFEMAFASEKVIVDFQDILPLDSAQMQCPDNGVEMVVADAQYLSALYRQLGLKYDTYRGTKVKLKSLGIWALMVKQCMIAFQKLRHRGIFMFRFSWRGTGQCVAADEHPSGEKVSPALLQKYEQEEQWYKACTYWLFSIVKSLFGKVQPFKSEYYHQADVSFYMVCTEFERNKFQSEGWLQKLEEALEKISNCADEEAIADLICSNEIAEDISKDIDGMLDYVGRIRAIGIESRKKSEEFQARKKAEQDRKAIEYDKWMQQVKALKENEGNSEASTACEGGALSSTTSPPSSDTPEHTSTARKGGQQNGFASKGQRGAKGLTKGQQQRFRNDKGAYGGLRNGEFKMQQPEFGVFWDSGWGQQADMFLNDGSSDSVYHSTNFFTGGEEYLFGFEGLDDQGVWQQLPAQSFPNQVAAPADGWHGEFMQMPSDYANSEMYMSPLLESQSEGFDFREAFLSEAVQPFLAGLPGQRSTGQGFSILPSALQASAKHTLEDASNSSSDSEERFRFRKRGGKSRRERKERKALKAGLPIRRRKDEAPQKTALSRTKAWLRRSISEMYPEPAEPGGKGLWWMMHICRIGLFCTMAWSIVRIAFSVVILLNEDQSFDVPVIGVIPANLTQSNPS